MSSSINTEKKSNIIFSSFHFMIALIFFLVILVNTVYLTKALIGMDVNQNDTNAVKAKNLMLSSCIISYVGDFLILLLFIENIKSNIDIKTFEVPENIKITDQDTVFALFGIY